MSWTARLRTPEDAAAFRQLAADRDITVSALLREPVSWPARKPGRMPTAEPGGHAARRKAQQAGQEDRSEEKKNERRHAAADSAAGSVPRLTEASTGRDNRRRASPSLLLPFRYVCHFGKDSPKCRHEHRLKQDPRWKVEQHPDGTFTWTTPSGRTYPI